MFGQDRKLGLSPEMNKHVTNPPLLQMEMIKSLSGINFSISTIIHIFDITEHCEKSLYTGQHKGTLLMEMFKGHGFFFENSDEQYHNWNM